MHLYPQQPVPCPLLSGCLRREVGETLLGVKVNRGTLMSF
jgi:hypothetical protein